MDTETKDNLLAVGYGILAALLVGGATLAFALLVTGAALGWQASDPTMVVFQIWLVVGFAYAIWLSK